MTDSGVVGEGRRGGQEKSKLTQQDKIVRHGSRKMKLELGDNKVWSV